MAGLAGPSRDQQEGPGASGGQGQFRAGGAALSRTAESRIVGLAALVQGLVLVTFPAVGAILTGTRDYYMSTAQYQALVLPELATALLASLTGFGLARRRTTRLAYRLGLTLSLLSLALFSLGLFLANTAADGNHAVAYALLLTAIALLGAGFGLTVPVLIAYARYLQAGAEDSSVLALNVLIGLGVLAAPVIGAACRAGGLWWVLPSLSAVLLAVLLCLSGRLPAHAGAAPGSSRQTRLRTVWFLLYAVFAMTYAVSSAVIVIWSQLRAGSPPGTPMQVQLTAAVQPAGPGVPPYLRESLMFAAFWAATLAAARILLAATDRQASGRARAVGYLLPILVLTALIVVGLLTHHHDLATVAIFGLAALGCAALLPLSISFGPKDVTAISAALAGGLIAYQLGYAIVVAGLRPHSHTGPGDLPIYAAAALIGIATALLSVTVVQRQIRLAKDR